MNIWIAGKDLMKIPLLFQCHLKKKMIMVKKITYKLEFIDNYRLMSTSSSNLVDNLSGVYDKECKKCMEKQN